MSNTDVKYDKEIAKQPIQRTYLEILKVHNKEVPIANLLAYFFNPKESHGLGDLFLRSLLKTNRLEYDKNEKKWKNSSIDENIEKHLDVLEKLRDEIKVKVEDSTNEDKRIDILIEVGKKQSDGDKMVIAIEFKIKHNLNNPLHNYITHVNSNYDEKYKKFFIILTPNRKPPKGDDAINHLENIKDNSEVFKMIVLSKMINNVYASLDRHLHEQSFIINDFIQMVRNRGINYHRGLLKDKIKEELKCEENDKYHFLYIRRDKIEKKIRITNSGIQLEKWEIGGKKKLNFSKDKEVEVLSFDLELNELLKEIKKFINE